MWATLPENKHNDAPRNPRVYESDLPTFTTDVRMHKVEELFATSAGKADSPEQTQGSGGGGPVEAVFWNKDVGTQWRMRGTAWIVDSQDIDETRGDIPGKVTSGVRAVKSEVGRRMRVVEGQEAKVTDWSWGREVTGHFGNCSPGMRGRSEAMTYTLLTAGSWRNPAPGTETHEQPDKDHELGQRVTDLEDPIARANFRVVIIKPDEVEQTDLSDPKSARRQLYTFVVDPAKGEDGERIGVWESKELWP